MIEDLIILITKLQAANNELVLNIDVNESFDSGKGGAAKLISSTKLVNPIACTHESNTFQTLINTKQTK